LLQRIRQLPRHPVFWAILLTALYLAGLATRASPYIFGPDEWRWCGRPPSPTTYHRWWLSLILLTVYLLVSTLCVEGRQTAHPSRRWEWGILAFMALMAPAIQVALTYIHNRYPLESYLHRVIGPHNGFWQIAIGTDDLGYYLRTYPQQMLIHPFVHTPVHPPGNFIYIWLWRKGFEYLPGLARSVAQLFRTYNCADLQFVRLEDAQIASALAQMVIPLFSGLPAIPLYLLGKRLVSPRAGLRAAGLYIVVPSLTLFTMRWDQLYPLALSLSLYWLHRGLEGQRHGLFFLAGFSVSIASFMSLGNLTILLALATYGLAHMASSGLTRWRWWLCRTWAGWVLLALGSASIWLAYQVAFGVSFWNVFSTAMQTHLHLGRTYWVWLGYNLYDFLTFLGVPAAVLFVAESAQAWKQAARARFRIPLRSLPALAVSIALLALDLSGVARGEVGRMWLPWMSAACLVVAIGLTQQRDRSYRLILALLALQSLFFTLFLRVAHTGMPSFQPREPKMTPPAVNYPLEARLGEEIALVGYDLEPLRAVPGETIHLILYWQALEQPARPYTVFTHLLDETGQLRGQQDNMPVGNNLPTTCWRAGEFVTDPYEISIASDAPAGTYTLEVGMYDLVTGERLPVSGPPGQPPDRLLLTPIQVLAP